MRLTYIVIFISMISLLHAEALDDMLEGFSQTNTTTISKTKIQEDNWLDVLGRYTFSSSLALATPSTNGEQDFSGLRKLRNKIDLTFDMRFSKEWKAKLELKANIDVIHGIRESWYFPTTARLANEKEAEVKEAYVLGTLGKVDVKIGRQIVVWGKSDSLRVTDVINPLDNREPGLVDIEDLRLPVTMSRFDYYKGDWNVQALLLHEDRVQKEAGINGDFFPTTVLSSNPSFTLPSATQPTFVYEDSQYALALNGRFNGWDLSLYNAYVLDSRWHFENLNTPKLSREYGHIFMNAAAMNIVLGAFSFKSEAAYFENLKYNTTQDSKERLDLLGGVEFNGISNANFSAEVVRRYIYDYESAMLGAADFVRQAEYQWAFRGSYTFDHDTTTISLLLTLMGRAFEEGGFARYWIDHDMNDENSISLGFVDYIGGEHPMYEALSQRDRLFFDYKYSF